MEQNNFNVKVNVKKNEIKTRIEEYTDFLNCFYKDNTDCKVYHSIKSRIEELKKLI
jgi:hypothetical protein